MIGSSGVARNFHWGGRVTGSPPETMGVQMTGGLGESPSPLEAREYGAKPQHKAIFAIF